MRIVFAGTPEFSVPCLQALLDMENTAAEVVGVVSQPDRRAGRGMRLTPGPVRQTALNAGIDIITPAALHNHGNALAWLRERDADFLVTVAFGMVFPKPWLHAARIAPVNVHASLLPRWRGAAPVERALLAGDDETGVCIMRMEAGLDTGGVYASRRIPITNASTGPDLRNALAAMGAELLVETLPRIASGELHPAPQDDSQATYAAKLSGEDRTIDWSRSAVSIDRQVRCFSPRPGARTRLSGKWLKIIRGVQLEMKTARRPGELLGHGRLDAACGDGSVYRLLKVQPEGKRPMDAQTFLRGNPPGSGQSLG